MEYAKLVQTLADIIVSDVRAMVKETGYDEESALDLTMETLSQDIRDYALAVLMDEEDV